MTHYILVYNLFINPGLHLYNCVENFEIQWNTELLYFIVYFLCTFYPLLPILFLLRNKLLITWCCMCALVMYWFARENKTFYSLGQVPAQKSLSLFWDEFTNHVQLILHITVGDACCVWACLVPIVLSSFTEMWWISELVFGIDSLLSFWCTMEIVLFVMFLLRCDV